MSEVEESQGLEYPKDILGREKCPRCSQLLPAKAEAKELHLLRHVIDDLNQTLTWIGETLQGIKNWGIPVKEGRHR